MHPVSQHLHLVSLLFFISSPYHFRTPLLCPSSKRIVFVIKFTCPFCLSHSSSHQPSHAAAYCPLCFLPCFALYLLLSLFFNSLHSYLHSCILYFQNYPRWRLSAFIPRCSSALRHCSSIDLYISSDLDLSTGFLIFSWSWLACVDSIYLLVYAARGASHQSHSSIYNIIYASILSIA
ncbi:uncharacterized protein EDB93DRAFT_862066 [Suillus bovinus]|uniref:uncharacterized protein n=1 Tax=Suillus bovinus TaxID=48563 RepID=UPI001B86A82A|nr:uncharacterized protein EDB93DRAFT_862066 [Suillus bovinus]KAG2133673.1 hypothetical protein EDB93DRAFT_862066 [Suillus bovinus]